MDGPISFVTTPDGVRLALSTRGEGPPLVLVRGWITHLELMWDEPAFRSFFERLATRHRVVRYDARGNGLSDRDISRPDLDTLVTDVETVMDGLELDRATIWGSTFGGPVAITYARRHPERVERLVLDGTFATLRLDEPRGRARSLASIIGTLPDDPEMSYVGLSYATDPSPTTPHEAKAERAVRSIDPQLAKHLYGLAASMDVTDDARHLRAPTLVLHRRESRAVPFECGRDLATLVPEARFVGLDGAAHNLWDAPAGAALAALAEFLGSDLTGLGREPPGAAGSGLTTILFTDLVSSTALTGRLGDEPAQELIRFHDATVGEALRVHRGIRVKHTGDGALARFASASAAIAAAISIQRQFEDRNVMAPECALLLRVGINAGEPVDEGGDMFGTAVQLAARLCAFADPGEIVVSNVVRELVAGKGYQFEDRGEVALRGFPDPVQAWMVRRGREPKERST